MRNDLLVFNTNYASTEENNMKVVKKLPELQSVTLCNSQIHFFSRLESCFNVECKIKIVSKLNRVTCGRHT